MKSGNKKRDYSVKGFRASAVPAGFKKDGTPDLALILSGGETLAAGVFTRNRVKAAPVLVSMDHLGNGMARAVVINAGNANACTGERGLEDARLSARLVGEALGFEPDEVLVSSTGVIGLPLDMDLFRKALPRLTDGLSSKGIQDAAVAMMTTDSFPKLSLFNGEAGGIPYRIVGMAKGAGMIMPDMATMLCVMMSDVRIPGERLREALKTAVDVSFNRISVDGDTSTNDSTVILANGEAGNRGWSDQDDQDFQQGLKSVAEDLAAMIVRDGEGATKLVSVEVRGAATPEDAVHAARTVAGSSLVKTAFYGQDPNWGRVMAALGRSGIDMREENISISIDDIKIVEYGLSKGSQAEKRAAERMRHDRFSMVIDLQVGEFVDKILTCDLTHRYIDINADYRT